MTYKVGICDMIQIYLRSIPMGWQPLKNISADPKIEKGDALQSKDFLKILQADAWQKGINQSLRQFLKYYLGYP